MIKQKPQVELIKALHQAQSLLTGPKANKKNPHFRSDYADLTAVLNAIDLPFQENGLSITQLFDFHETGQNILITRLMHVSGEYIESRMLFPVLNDPQKMGSHISYFRRYAILAIAGIPGKDDDANIAAKQVKVEEFIREKTANDPISATDLQKLRSHSNFCPELEAEILQKLKIDSLNEIKNINAKVVCDYIRNWKSNDVA
jgi:hypothetical protein